ncbi:universal stress protein YxiE [Pullulanibacillus camelliae]|uniref:Universal stress protein YxiE n=1 Tax=Pullulanibacillus camelliae TaxID=1707096 RepID=A0A8J2YG61_9BACL|nr:universal stress protein [Pullulanibacillus camelliae]GGE36972.1 universal stress protein YxiE [Pullulanibacillus camelliae]
MSQKTKLLVAYDGSLMGEKVLEKAEQIAALKQDVAITILTVNKSELTPKFYTESIYIDYEALNKEVKKELLQALEYAKQEIKSTSQVATELLEGDPGMAIVGFAKEQATDLIIIGNRGLNRIKEVFLGSVSHYVAQYAPCPVLIVK